MRVPATIVLTSRNPAGNRSARLRGRTGEAKRGDMTGWERRHERISGEWKEGDSSQTPYGRRGKCLVSNRLSADATFE